MNTHTCTNAAVDCHCVNALCCFDKYSGSVCAGV